MKNIITLLILFVSHFLFGQTASLSGSIKDEDEKAVSGASLHLLNTEYRTSADKEGKFLMQQIIPGKYILRITANGYATTLKEVDISGGTNETDVQLKSEYEHLEEVVV